jgi:o-succinylbenzoate synthase
MNKVPLTEKGAQQLREELQQLKTVVRPKVVAAIAEARAHGDAQRGPGGGADRHELREGGRLPTRLLCHRDGRPGHLPLGPAGGGRRGGAGRQPHVPGPALTPRSGRKPPAATRPSGSTSDAPAELRLERLVLREIRLPLREPFRISSGTVSERRILLIESHHPDGAIGWSECVAAEWPNYSPETIDTAWLVIRQYLAPAVLGLGFEHPGAVWQALERVACGHPMAKAALEMGAWELAARLAGQPLSSLLGGTREKIPTGISLGIQESADALVARARDAAAAGYRRIKLKIKPGADLEYVRAVRDDLADAPLSVDANSAYTLADASHLARFDELDLLMLEQPLARDDLVRHAELQRRLRTPLCLDESITSAARAEDMIRLGSGRIINIKPGRVGGFTSALAIHDLCLDADVPVWCGGMLESGVGRAHNVALAALPNFRLPGDLSPSARYWEADIVRPEWTMDAAGMVAVPLSRPGMGVEVDRDRVEDLTTRCESLTA